MIMTTLTIKVNKKTKAGKAFMTMTNTFFKDAVGVEIIEKPEITNSGNNQGLNLLQQIETALSQVKDSKVKSTKRKTLEELLNEQ